MYSGLSGRQRVGTATNVNDPNTAWVNMEPHWVLIETLMTGTYGIRKKHRTYLPQEPRELDEASAHATESSSMFAIRMSRARWVRASISGSE